MYSEELMEDAEKLYGCNCDECCLALLTERSIEQNLKKDELRYGNISLE